MTSMISDDIQKRLAENVKRIRKSKKLTQFQLAEIADVSEETIKNIAQIKQTIAEELKSYIETKLNEIIR